MNRRLLGVIGACAVTVVLSAGCGSSNPIGTLHHGWSQPDDPVMDYTDTHPSPLLIRGQSEFEKWQQSLPAAMAPPVEDVVLDDQIAVVGSYAKCMDVGSVQDLGGGEIRFDVSVPQEDKNVNCAGSPLNVELWVVGLEELDVESADDVTLID